AYEAGRRDDWHEGFFDAHVLQGVLKVVDVSTHLRGVVGNRTGAHDLARGPFANGGLGIEIGEFVALAPEAVVRRRAWRRGTDLEATDAVEDIAGPVRFTELAVADDVEAGVGLFSDGVGDGGAQGLVEGFSIDVRGSVEELAELGGTDQAADECCQNP